MDGLKNSEVADLVRALVDTVAEVTGRVYVGRSAPLPDEKLPCVLIYANDNDDSWNGTYRSPRFWRELLVQIQYFAYANDDAGLQTAALISDKILDAILNDAAFVQKFPSFPSMRRRTGLAVDGGRRRVLVQLDVTVRYEVAWNQC